MILDFKTAVEFAVQKFNKYKNKTVGIISHNDTDGVTSAAIIVKALQRAGLNFHLHFITRTDEDVAAYISSHKYEIYFLLDYGSNEVEKISKQNPDKVFFVLDHHPPIKGEFKNVIHVNPNFFGIDGGADACAASVCYFFAKSLSPKNKDLIHLAIVGAIGDSQKKDDKFSGLNQEIFKEAISSGLVSQEKGLRFYGWSSRPLHKALEYSTEPFIPGISGSESAAVQFLQELGIPLKKEDGSWRTINDLSDDEKKKLATALIAQRHQIHEHPEKIFEEKIILPKFQIEELREAEVLSATLNACAKLERFGLALGIALGDKLDYDEGIKIMQDYKKQIIEALNLFYANRKNPDIVQETENAIYFLGIGRIGANLISTISTILSKNLEDGGKILFCFAKANKLIKISVRYIGPPKGIKLGELCSKLAAKFGGEGGGHAVAAGATIPLDKVEMFINASEEMMKEYGQA